MKLRLSTLAFWVALAAISLGWFIDRRHLVSHLGQQSLEALSVESAVAKGTIGNCFVQKQIDFVKHEINEEQFNAFKDDTLVENIVVLYEADLLTVRLDVELEAGIRFRSYQAERIDSAAREAVRLLDLPDVESVNDFRQRRPILFQKFVSELEVGGNKFDDGFLNFLGLRTLHW